MSTHDREPQPGDAPLPVVTQDVLNAVSAEFIQSPGQEAVVLAQMEAENPVLAEGIGRAIMALGQGHKQITKDILTAATMLYGCLRSQADANSMNGLFGSPEPGDLSE
jgi:hypothetical protein